MLPTCLRRNERRDPCGTGCARALGVLAGCLRSAVELPGVGTVGEIALAWLVLALSA